MEYSALYRLAESVTIQPHSREPVIARGEPPCDYIRPVDASIPSHSVEVINVACIEDACSEVVIVVECDSSEPCTLSEGEAVQVYFTCADEVWISEGGGWSIGIPVAHSAAHVVGVEAAI